MPFVGHNPQPPGTVGRPRGSTGPHRVSYDPVNKNRVWHLVLVEAIIDNPTATYEEIGKLIGRTKESVGMLLRSDFVKARIAGRLAERREQSDAIIQERLRGTALHGLKELDRRLTVNPDRMSNEEVIDANKTLFNALGLSPQRVGSEPPQNQVNIAFTVPSSVLQEARSQLREIEAHALPEKVAPRTIQAPPEGVPQERVLMNSEPDSDGR